jgi:hypothetical protein
MAAYEIKHEGETYLAEEDGGYRNGHNGKQMDSYRIWLVDANGDYQGCGRVSISRGIKPTSKGFAHAIKLVAFEDYKARFA